MSQKEDVIDPPSGLYDPGGVCGAVYSFGLAYDSASGIHDRGCRKLANSMWYIKRGWVTRPE